MHSYYARSRPNQRRLERPNMTKMKPEDLKAADLHFGVELETVVPANSGINIGGYHQGAPVNHALVLGEPHQAPSFDGARWRAERDGSLQAGCPEGYVPCEFVSPILRGEAGVQNLIAFVQWVKSIGGKVTSSCGVHIHVGVASVIGPTSSPDDTINFLCKLGAISQRLGLAFYSQTGTARHQNQFCRPLTNNDKRVLDDAKRDRTNKVGQLCHADKYRLVNFRCVGSKGTVEFRAFAGTLNVDKVLHHLATALGTCRYAAVVKRAQWGVNRKNWWKDAGNGENALRLLWAVFGWQAASSSSTHSFGLFGSLYASFARYHKVGLAMATKFDNRYPAVVLEDGMSPEGRSFPI